MARLSLADAAATGGVTLGGQANRARTLAHHPAMLELVATIESTLAQASTLAHVHRAIAIGTVTRRNRYVSGHVRPQLVRDGFTEEMIEAIDHEDWTDDAFDDLQKNVFRYCLMYDAGHGIGDPVYEQVAGVLSPADIVELSMICSYWGGVARFCIALQVDPEE